MTTMTIGKNIAGLRKKNGMTQEQLANNFGYNPNVKCDHHDHEHGEGEHTCGNHGCGTQDCGNHDCAK